MVAKGLKYIESLVNVKAGHIAGQDPKPQLQNYVTSINVMALSRRQRRREVQEDRRRRRRVPQEAAVGRGATARPRTDDFYGGAGYDSKSRPDLSNTQFFLEALKDGRRAARTTRPSRRRLVFVSRCQNLKSECNDQPWAGKINDGSFIYSAAGGGQTKVPTSRSDGSLPGYGSMTYAGIKSLIYCGVSKDDPRLKKALEWTQKNYTLDANPGMPKVRGTGPVSITTTAWPSAWTSWR